MGVISKFMLEDSESWLGVSEGDVGLKKIKFIESVVKKVSRHDEYEYFGVIGSGEGTKLFISLTGKKLISAIHGVRSRDYPVGYFGNAYVNAFVEVVNEVFDGVGVIHEYGEEVLVRNSFDVLNSVVVLVRRRVSSDAFQDRLNFSRRLQKKRLSSLHEYEMALFDMHSKLMVLRIDLSYRKGAFIDSDSFSDDLEVVKSHWAKMRFDISRGFPVKEVLGSCASLEYGVLTGFHFHLVVFIDGAKYRSDIVLAKIIGDHWVENITGGEGRYFNCNAIKERYSKLGIGTINHYDKEARNNLKNFVMKYLSEPDEHIRTLAPRERSFFRGNLPKGKVGRRLGRPRLSFRL